MDKHSKRSSSLLHYPVLVVFSLFFIGLFALDLITPDRATAKWRTPPSASARR